MELCPHSPDMSLVLAPYGILTDLYGVCRCIFFIYTVRVKRWTFGFSTLFGGFGRVMGMAIAMGLFKRKNKMVAEVKEEM
jgi:hypothetical protein